MAASHPQIDLKASLARVAKGGIPLRHRLVAAIGLGGAATYVWNAASGALVVELRQDASDRDFGHPGQQGIRSIGPAVLRG